MQGVKIVGALNATPDSFYDGGRYNDTESIVKRAGEMLQEGADVIEIGGQSTGPGSKDVSAEEELARVVGALEAIHAAYQNAVLSIDTFQASVAQAAVDAGATMINDVTAGRGDAQLFSIAANANTDLVLMYAKDDTPRTTVQETEYPDVIQHIHDFLSARMELAVRAGVDAGRIIIDPGLGHFVSSDPKYSFEILANLEKFADMSDRIFVSPSRKSFVAGSEKLPTEDRLPGTIAASVAAVVHGAKYIRTHDVLAVRRACEIAEAIHQQERQQ